MLTTLFSSNTGIQARQMLERKPPTWTSTLSSSRSFVVLRGPAAGFLCAVGENALERRAVAAAGGVDGVDRHLQAAHRGLAAERGGAGERLQRAELVWRRRPEGLAPRRRPQHGRADRAHAPADKAAARDLAAVPHVLCPGFVLPFFSHCE